MIELDRTFIVRNYNRPESLSAQRRPEETIGQPFFEKVAPCADTPEFRERIEALMRPGASERDARFAFVFQFPWGRRSVIIRALRDEQLDTCWVFITPLRAHDQDELDHSPDSSEPALR